MLYFIQQADAPDYVKIGFARDPVRRLRELQVASPKKLLVVDIVEGDRAEEAALHRRLKAKGKHASGEWYQFDREVQEILAAYSHGSLRQAIEREEALRRAGLIFADMTRQINRLRKVISNKR
jgi:predicted GIY-YIG superfamily endonuclease